MNPNALGHLRWGCHTPLQRRTSWTTPDPSLAQWRTSRAHLPPRWNTRSPSWPPRHGPRRSPGTRDPASEPGPFLVSPVPEAWSCRSSPGTAAGCRSRPGLWRWHGPWWILREPRGRWRWSIREKVGKNMELKWEYGNYVACDLIPSNNKKEQEIWN